MIYPENTVQIEILYIIVISLITLFSILAYTKKMSTGIALFSLLTGIGITWLLNNYISMLIHPLSNTIFYGYSWNLFTIMVLAQIVLVFIAVIVRGYNLYISGGKIGWA